ncbi:hypothetical protein [Ekhidna sp.]|uniref:hypothetical protein n=1 Tax=Ekhidna sp. TaxID=2608089 RepID=UPI003299A0CE
MKNLKCIVFDKDKFTKELMISFIAKTDGVITIKARDLKKADVIFVDADLFDGNYMTGLPANTKIVIVSSSQDYIHSLFKKEITDYFKKSELSLRRFEEAIKKIRISRKELKD